LERFLHHPEPRVQLYVAEQIYQGERERAESCFMWEQAEPPSAGTPAHQWRVLLETDLTALWREMEDGNFLEPSVDGYE
jgi:hypothetical protein